MTEFSRWQAIEAEWAEIEESYRLAPFSSPINRSEELQRVLDAHHEGRSYDPVFHYNLLPAFPSARIRRFQARLHPDQSPVEALYEEKARNELLAIECLQTRDPAVITAASCLSDGLPDKTLLAAAWRILPDPPAPEVDEPKTLTAQQAAARLQQVIDRLGLAGWQAQAYAPMSASMSVHGLDREVHIRDGALFSEHDVRRLAVHEVGVHVLRWENACLQPLRLFRGFPGYMATEEGLTVTSEERSGLLEAATLRKYAGRVVGVNLALSGSFSDVFAALAPHMDLEMAFDIATRVKRGFVDTSEPGAYTKDMVYLQGYLAVKAYLAEKPDDLPLLMLGKFGLQHLPLVREWLVEGLLVPARYLPLDIPRTHRRKLSGTLS